MTYAFVRAIVDVLRAGCGKLVGSCSIFGREGGERFVDELTEANLVVLLVRAWMRK